MSAEDRNPEIPIEVIEQTRDMGAITYLGAYIHLMARHLGIDDLNTPGASNGILLRMVEPINYSTEATWCAIMGDIEGRDQALEKFKESLDKA